MSRQFHDRSSFCKRGHDISQPEIKLDGLMSSDESVTNAAKYVNQIIQIPPCDLSTVSRQEKQNEQQGSPTVRAHAFSYPKSGTAA